MTSPPCVPTSSILGCAGCASKQHAATSPRPAAAPPTAFLRSVHSTLSNCVPAPISHVTILPSLDTLCSRSSWLEVPRAQCTCHVVSACRSATRQDARRKGAFPAGPTSTTCTLPSWHPTANRHGMVGWKARHMTAEGMASWHSGLEALSREWQHRRPLTGRPGSNDPYPAAKRSLWPGHQARAVTARPLTQPGAKVQRGSKVPSSGRAASAGSSQYCDIRFKAEDEY